MLREEAKTLKEAFKQGHQEDWKSYEPSNYAFHRSVQRVLLAQTLISGLPCQMTRPDAVWTESFRL